MAPLWSELPFHQGVHDKAPVTAILAAYGVIVFFKDCAAM